MSGLGANRSEAQDNLNKMKESDKMPALVQTEGEMSDPSMREVSCVVRTPGPDVLLEELFRRVWGVSGKP